MMKRSAALSKNRRVVAWLFVLVGVLSAAPILSAVPGPYQEAFSAQRLWFSRYWNPRGYIGLTAAPDQPTALACPTSFRLADESTSSVRVIDVEVDTWFDEESVGIGCLFFSSDACPNRLFFLAIDASGRWNLYQESYSGGYVCSALDVMIGSHRLYAWKTSDHLRSGPYAPNRLSIRFQPGRTSAGASGIRIVAFINGFEVATVQTDLPPDQPIRIGIAAHLGGEGEETRVWFDNLVIRPL